MSSSERSSGTRSKPIRPSLIPSLLKSTAANLRYFDSFRIFEGGRVFANVDFRPLESSSERLPRQRRHLGAAFVGRDLEELFLEAKGLIEIIQRAVHILPLTFSRDALAPWAATNARLGLESNGQCVGVLAVATNRTKRLSDIKRSDVVLFELDIDALTPLPSRENTYSRLPEFPEVEIDLSFVLEEQIEWDALVRSISGLHELIRGILLVDQFRGKGIPDHSKSITLRLRLGSATRTLTADEAKEIGNLVAERLRYTFGARLRA